MYPTTGFRGPTRLPLAVFTYSSELSLQSFFATLSLTRTCSLLSVFTKYLALGRSFTTRFRCCTSNANTDSKVIASDRTSQLWASHPTFGQQPRSRGTLLHEFRSPARHVPGMFLLYIKRPILPRPCERGIPALGVALSPRALAVTK
ncbi:hypothetical protein JTE90_001097 [Oedothorax gibbosus]|uniref:Uncharacterized protein n=1 Tax=Oedothorax gibbosus TaxID=931172 RepID=A0AAV6TDI4_9ARAC|nr:hypothetical protein JTE90_001097 [Oedothorax gibbosus]